jgi:hypothetical protein
MIDPRKTHGYLGALALVNAILVLQVASPAQTLTIPILMTIIPLEEFNCLASCWR